MSKQIDERVVEMRFDNSQFEKNVSTTLSTLEKLKRSLNLTGAAKGIEDIGAAAKKVDMNGLANGVETVGLKFNAMYTIADQVLRNITTKAQHAAEQMVKSLTIQPITTGFNEYELKMGSIQTIMASTGESLDTVNKYLNELNEYSDKTIYSFSDMTTNIGKFTNAGVKLEDAVMAIKGISNEAAVSGANANEASRAMYNFAQALSAGFVKLIDWKSIENANMATVEFKNQLLESAVAAGTLEKQANGMYKVLSTNTQGSTFDQMIDATHYFNDSLNYQWMTTEALVSTLKNYADETTDIGKKAYASAQDIKTFSQMMDTLKETAQSGWATTWEIVFGDLETAKKIWTSLGDVVGKVLDSMSDSRNNLLRGAFTSNWDKLSKDITNAGISTEQLESSMKDVLESHGEDVDALIEKHGSLDQAFRKEAWGSEYLKEALEGINEELIDLSGITRKLQKGDTGDDVKKIQQALKDAGYQCGEFGDQLDGVDGIIGDVTENAIKAFQEANGITADGIIGPETLKALEEANTTSGKLKKNIKQLVKTIDHLDDGLGKLGGRELAIESLKNIFEVIKQVLGLVKKSWDNVFDSFEASDLYNLIERFHDFTETLEINKETADKISYTFDGLFTVLKVIKDIIVAIVETGFKLVKAVFKPLANIVLSATSAFGKFLKTGGKALSDVFEPMGEIVSKVIDIVGKLAETIGDMVVKGIDKLSELEFVKDIGEWFSNSADRVSEAIDRINGYLHNLDTNVFFGGFGKIGKFFSSIGDWWNGFKVSEKGSTIIEGIIAPLKSLWDTITGFELPNFSFDSITNKLFKFFDYLKTNNFTGFTGSIKGAFSYLKYILDTKWANFTNNAIVKFSDFYLKYGDSIKAGVDKCKEVVGAIIQFVFDTKQLTLGDILDLAEKIVTIGLLWQTLHVVENISGALENIGSGLSNIGAGIKWNAIKGAIWALAGVLGVFTICMKIIEGMDGEAVKRSCAVLLTALTLMGAIIAGLLLLSTKVTGTVNLVAVTGIMLAIALSLAIIVHTLKTIDTTEFKNLKSSFATLISALLVLLLGMVVVGKTCGTGTLKTAVALLTFFTAMKMLLDVLDAYAAYDWGKVSNAIPKVATVLLGLALIMRIATGGIKAGASVSGMAFLVIATVLSLKLLIGAIAEMGEMPVDQANQGIKMVMIILGGITAMLGVLNLTNKGGILEKGQKNINGFTGLASALLAVAITIAILGNLPTDVLKKGGAAVITILGMFTVILSVVGKAMTGATGFVKITSMIIGMGLIIAELAIIMHLLRDINGTDALAKFGAIALVLIAMTGCLQTLTKHTTKPKNIYKWILAMLVFSTVVGVLARILWLIQGVDGANAIAQFFAISMVLAIMGITLENLSGHYRIKPENINKWVLAMMMMSMVVGVLGVIMRIIQDVDGLNAVGQFGAISIALIAMAACIKVLSTIPASATANATAALAPLGLLMLELAAVITVIMGALGVIDKLTKGGFADVMERSVGILTSIGKAIGGLIGGLGAGITSGLPKMGQDLSNFMAGASVFFAGLKTIDASMVTNAGHMVAVIAELIKAAGDNGWDNIFSMGRSLPNLGTDLSNFMTNAAGFFTGLAFVDLEMANSAKAIAETLKILTEAAALDSVTFGNIENFSAQLIPFGEAMVQFSQTISGKIDPEAVKAAADAAGMMAALNQELPREYGAISGLFASTPISLDTFGGQLISFGQALVGFSKLVSTEGSINTEAIETAKNAAEIILALNDTLPREYGGISGLFASNPIPLDTFGSQLLSFGQALIGFSRLVSTEGAINTEAIETAKGAASIMATLANKLPTQYGGIIALFKDQPIALDTFGTQLVSFGRSMIMFSNVVKAGSIDQAAIEAARDGAAIMSTFAKDLPTETSVFDKWFGDGGTMSLKDFGKHLVKFGESIVDFSEAISGKIDLASVNVVLRVSQGLVDLVKTLPEDMDLTVLKDGLTDLSTIMVDFSEAVTGKVDTTVITTVVEAAKTLAQAASIMPAEVDFEKITNGLDSFGTAIVEFSSEVSGLVDGGAVATAATAGKDIAAMVAAIPKEISTGSFIDCLGELGPALVGFSTALTGTEGQAGINTLAFENAVTACGYLNSILSYVAMVWDVSWFLDNIASVAQAIVDFSSTISAEGAINSEAITSATTAGTQIGDMMNSMTAVLDVTSFVENARAVSKAIVNFSNTVSYNGGIKSDSVTSAVTAGEQIAGLIVTCGNIIDVSNFVDSSRKLAGAIADFSTDVYGTIKTKAISTAVTYLEKIRTAMTDLSGTPDISGKLTMIKDLGTTMVDFSATVEEVAVSGLSADCETFKSMVESFGELSESGVKAFISNLDGSMTKTLSSIHRFFSAAIKLVKSYATNFYVAGGDLVAGFASGITASTWKAESKSAAMAAAALAAAKAVLRSNSPSKAFYDLGTYAGQGFTNAFDDYEGKSAKAGSTMAMSAMTGLRDALAKAQDFVINGIDSQPTIRPVLDLSGVTADASKITSLFDMSPSVGVMANVGAISRGMANRQNGTTDDVIGAINSLRKDLGNVGGTSYNINGITYDDGSNISDAVKTLVRAAKIERRV